MKNRTIPKRGIQKRQSSGYILITGLIFLLITTLVTSSSMQSSNLDYKISANAVFKDLAFQGSESGRTASGEALSYFIYEREWANLSVSNLTYTENYDPTSDVLQSGESLYNTSSLGVDMFFDVTGTSVETIDADISVLKSPGISSLDSGMQQLSGYEGLGKGAAAGGIHLIYEIRSTGRGSDSAVAVTASEYRVIP